MWSVPYPIGHRLYRVVGVLFHPSVNRLLTRFEKVVVLGQVPRDLVVRRSSVVHPHGVLITTLASPQYRQLIE